MNQLHLETSPYLLQHANNPVHWKAWNNATLATAKDENKLIIVSVGYSACHWCHVMEHESFEDEDVAQTMNKNFISIKVDREERPDIDAVYMKAVQVMTSRGGWPMNVICLPNGKPVWGGTYFRKNEWIDYLEQLQELYVSNPEKLVEYSEKLYEGLQAISVIQNENPTSEFNFETIDLLIQKWQKSFDLDFGGMARAPKFMMPTNYEFLLHYAHQSQNQPLLDFVNLTLTKMAYGGLFDTIDGGFSRYSVDLKWHVPHFEKMLYDNGQLVSLYSNAYKLTQNPLYKEVIEKTLSFVEKEFLTTEFGFYSALDADSLNHENHLEEGAFYVWTKQELQEIIKDDFDLFSQVFNINEFGYWEKENYVLIQNQSLKELALQNSISENELHQKKISWEKLLYTEREKRSKPRLDDKCLCSWNAIMLKGFIDGYKATQNKKYLEIALKNSNFIEAKFLSEEGNLFHNYKNGTTTINGYLEDYCFVIDAFIGLYQITLDENWLLTAKQLTDYCLDNFYDETKQFFRFTSIKDDELITTHFEIEDNVIPASNSVMANNLVVLSKYFNNSHYEKTAEKMLHHVLENIDYPSAFSNWLNVSIHFSDKSKELAVCSSNAAEFIKKINSKYLPDILIAGTDKKSNLPFLTDRFQENETLFYLCKNKTCDMPTGDFEEIMAIM
jgi:uncharacterized protein YyaL (SSP411 family)